MGNLPFIWQVVVVVLIIAGLIYLLSVGVGVCSSQDDHEGEVVWDGNLIEGGALVPKWWFWSGIAASVFAVIYMLFFPSFGNYKGLLNASLDNQYTKNKANIDDDYYRKITTLEATNIEDLQLNDNAMRIAGNTFEIYCQSCHAKDGKGQKYFPNLTDQAWNWGGSAEQITHTITQGRRAIMPAWGAMLKEEGVTNVANYVKSIADNTYNKEKHAAGEAKYKQVCLGCHGINMQGNHYFGAPNLGDSAWIYGGDLATIKESIRSGRQGVMPAHKDRLTPLQIKLLVAWLRSNAK